MMQKKKTAGAFEDYLGESLVVGEEDLEDADYTLDEMIVEDEGDFASDTFDFSVNDEDFAIDKEIDSETSLVVDELKDLIPGSDLQYMAPQEEERRDSNWADDGDHAHFIAHLTDKLSKVPRHSGNTIPGCERACSYMKSMDGDISKAMRSDLGGKIDENAIDQLRARINKDIELLENQIKKLRGNKKTAHTEARLVSRGECNECESVTPLWHDIKNDREVCLHCSAESNSDEAITKEATTPVINVYITPFERAVVGTIINSKVSAGRHIEETYAKMKNKYNFTPREELALQQLIADYGYPFVKDRGLLNEESDPQAGTGVDFGTNYHA